MHTKTQILFFATLLLLAPYSHAQWEDFMPDTIDDPITDDMPEYTDTYPDTIDPLSDSEPISTEPTAPVEPVSQPTTDLDPESILKKASETPIKLPQLPPIEPASTEPKMPNLMNPTATTTTTPPLPDLLNPTTAKTTTDSMPDLMNPTTTTTTTEPEPELAIPEPEASDDEGDRSNDDGDNDDDDNDDDDDDDKKDSDKERDDDSDDSEHMVTELTPNLLEGTWYVYNSTSGDVCCLPTGTVEFYSVSGENYIETDFNGLNCEMNPPSTTFPLSLSDSYVELAQYTNSSETPEKGYNYYVSGFSYENFWPNKTQQVLLTIESSELDCSFTLSMSAETISEKTQ